MVESGTFPYGLTNAAGVICKEFSLAERTFGHMLQLGNDPAISKDRLSEPAYYDAAIISKRLTVAGIPALSPETILDLDGDDGDELARVMMLLDQRRGEFRKALQPPAQAAAGTP